MFLERETQTYSSNKLCINWSNDAIDLRKRRPIQLFRLQVFKLGCYSKAIANLHIAKQFTKDQQPSYQLWVSLEALV